MKTGEAYLHSREKRIVDLVASHSLHPLERLAALVARNSFSPVGNEAFAQERVGQNDELFDVIKWTTLADDDETPINDTALWFRTNGVDELSQLKQVRDGEMSMAGRRPLLPNEYDYMRDIASKRNRGRLILAKFDDLVVPSKTGMLSSYAIATHQGAKIRPIRYFSMEVDDHENASLANDARLANEFGKALLKRRLTAHKVPVTKAA